MDLKSEYIIFKVREKLNADKVKLWLKPFYNENNEQGPEEEEALQVLCRQMSEQLNIPQEQCILALRELQSNALDRLKANEVFKETGIASLRVKVSGVTPKTVTVSVALSCTSTQLMEEVGRAINTDSDRIKLISQGTVLKPTDSLMAQGVKNGQQLMAVIVADEGPLKDSEKRFKTLESTKKDVKLLAGRSNPENEYYFEVENQSGEALDLPFHERKALVTAMALHEKGRVALKKEDYSLALVLFLEADKEYSACNSQLLSACDNYALLHLDVAWCYLCLRNPAQIPDAENRLSLCEKNFHKSYGPNLERLLAIKGTTGNEAALFMRLHLLQGVVCFHQNRRDEARRLFERAQSELSGLKVDDNSVCLLMELGFTSGEARLGLRATHNNIEAAEELIQRKRKEKDLAQQRNKAQRLQEKERIKLGMCADGKQFCDPRSVDQLVCMGFAKRQSIAALKLSNNNMSEALSIIQDKPHLLPSCSNSVSEETVAQVASLGVEPDVAREALETYPELERAVRSLTTLSSNLGENSQAIAAASASAMSFLEKMKKKQEAVNQRVSEEFQAFKRVSEDLLDNGHTEDHLDLNLNQEEEFLMEYLSLLD